MSSRWTGFFVWALVVACAALWGFKIFAATRPVPDNATTPQAEVVAQGPWVRLFGAEPVVDKSDPPPPSDSERFQLVGVIAPRSGDAGYAIVTIDNGTPKPWKIGATLDGDTTLLSVSKRSAKFGPAGGPAAFTLDLPEPAEAETGTLPEAVSQPDGPAPTPRAQTQPQPIQQMPGQPIPGAVRGAQPLGGFHRPGMMPPNALPPGRVAPGMMGGAQQPQPAVQDNQVQKDDE